jgi:hypothetical protein
LIVLYIRVGAVGDLIEGTTGKMWIDPSVIVGYISKALITFTLAAPLLMVSGALTLVAAILLERQTASKARPSPPEEV